MRRVKIYLYGWSVFSFYQGMVRTMIIMSFSKRTSVLRRPWDPVGAVTSKPPAKGFLFPNRCSRLPSSLDRERKRFYAWSFISIPHSGWVKIPSHDCALIVAFDFNRLAVKSIKKHFRLKQIVKKPTRRNAILDLVLITLHIFYDEPLSSPSPPPPPPPWSLKSQHYYSRAKGNGQKPLYMFYKNCAKARLAGES